MNTFKKISQQIKNEEIKHIPKLYFISRRTIIWVSFILSVIFGAIAFSVILFSVQQSDFELLTHTNHSIFESILVFLPFFWIIILFVFSIFAFYSISNSKKAYKYSLTSLLGLSTFMSILIGTLVFISGGAKKLEQSFANKVEIYKSLQERKLEIWMNPEKGMLAGTIQKIVFDTIYIKDFSEKDWIVTYNNVFIPPILELETGVEIKIVGMVQNNNFFVAKDIRPWKGFGKQSVNDIQEQINELEKTPKK